MSERNVLNVTVMDGITKQNHFYEAAGADRTFQKTITHFLNKRAAECGYTLPQLGYLHMNFSSYSEENGLDVKIYFYIPLATKTKRLANNSTVTEINPVLNIFQNYLFVGDVKNVATFEEVSLPKHFLEKDDMGKYALRFKKLNKAFDQEGEVLAIHCNMAMVLAAVHDVSLFTPGFAYSTTTVASASTNDNSIVAIGTRQEHPMKIHFEYAINHAPYNPNEAVKWLQQVAGVNYQMAEEQKRLTKKVSEQAKDMARKRQVKSTKFYSKYKK